MSQFLAMPIGLLLSGVLVWQASNASFIGTTTNPGNTWSVGTVNLTNDSGGVPMFQVTNMVPGNTGSHCIKVTSTASVPSAVKLYANITAPPTTDVSPYINLKIEEGTGGTFASCAAFNPTGGTAYNGTLADFTANHTNFATGVGPWSLTGTPPEDLTYRFTWTFSNAAPPSTESGSTPTVNFVWEAQNS
ncbi:hypothetical protein [Sphaerisporangium fuscum]|uniref:hypothetical protein n=1 Tax=Sphaerisporangium fuscum TaxID=2835868 RepID=UPI001BDCC731|nr:hypothetical protein [Sphaerisporangium fuscum]